MFLDVFFLAEEADLADSKQVVGVDSSSHEHQGSTRYFFKQTIRLQNRSLDHSRISQRSAIKKNAGCVKYPDQITTWNHSEKRAM